jgi:hypothetical protein
MKGTNYITLGYNFLKLSINAIDEMEKQGNKTIIFSDGEKSENETNREFEQKTKWNDLNVGIPVLFNFFHGVELMLKGLILHCDGELNSKTHKLTELLRELRQTANHPVGLAELFNEILTNNGFEKFFAQNGKDIDSFYELFKYPVLRTGADLDFRFVRGNEQKGLERFLKIRELSISIRTELVVWKSSV